MFNDPNTKGIIMIREIMKKFKALTRSGMRAVARLWGIRAKKAKGAEADDVSKPGFILSMKSV